MRESSSYSRRRRPLIGSMAAAPALLMAASLIVLAQSPNPFGVPPRAPGSSPAAGRSPQQPRPPASPVIARVAGRIITQQDFDRMAQPYFQGLKAQLGNQFTGDALRIASLNVLDELIRREVLVIESQRENIQVSQAEIDTVLQQDPFFRTDGKFDAAKFNGFKMNPASNYLQVLPELRQIAAIRRLDGTLRRRFTPTPEQLRAEWAKRSDQARFKILPLFTRDMSIEAEATEAEWAQYYQAHADQFMRKTRVRLRYARLPLPPQGDSTRAGAASTALARAHSIADSLRLSALPDSAAELADTGLFDVPSALVPGLGRVAGLSDTLDRIDQDSTIRVVGPYTAGDAVIVGVCAERQPRHLPRMREVLGDVKRRADVEKRRATTEAEQRAFYQEHRDRWRGARASLTRVTLTVPAIVVTPPPPQAVDRWYAEHGRTLFGVPENSKAWQPPITDSLRAVVRGRMIQDQRERRATETMERLAAALRTGRDARSLAKAAGAVAETLSLVSGSSSDTLFGSALADSLLASAAHARGTVAGPRSFGAVQAVWRVDSADEAFVPPYDVVRARSDREFVEERRGKEEAEARSYFDQHRGEFMTPEKYALDVVTIRIPAPDSVRIPEAELRRHYDADLKNYTQEEQVKVRHILFSTRAVSPTDERVAKERADSLLAAIRHEGGDFAELARRFSQEPGAATSGGDLGWFGRGQMVKEFEDAAFALKPGEISAVVKTQFGYHILALEDRKASGTRPFAEVRSELRTQLARARGDSTARRSAEALRRRLALGGNAMLLAAPHGGVVSAPPIVANEGVPGAGFAQGLGQDLPGASVGTWLPKTYRAGVSFLVLRLREKAPQQPAAFEESRARAIEAVKNAKRRAVLNRNVEAIRSGLSAGASLDSLAAPFGGLKDTGLVGQAAGFVPGIGNDPRLMQKVFSLKPGEVTDTLQVAQGVLWVLAEERQSGDPAAFKAASPMIEADVMKRKYDEWLADRKKTLRIEVLRSDLRGPRPSPIKTVAAGG